MEAEGERGIFFWVEVLGTPGSSSRSYHQVTKLTDLHTFDNLNENRSDNNL